MLKPFYQFFSYTLVEDFVFAYISEKASADFNRLIDLP